MLQRKLLCVALCAAVTPALAQQSLSLKLLGSHESGVFDEGAAEIVAYENRSPQLFVINAAAGTVDMLDIADPANPTLVGSIDVIANIPLAGGVNSVAANSGIIAVAVENENPQANGWVAFYGNDGTYLNHVEAGPLPDSVTFTPDGRYVLSANEGQPSDDYSVDPEGSISVIDVSKGAANATVKTATFTAFNDSPPSGVRISGPGASVAQDLEPEYITVSAHSRHAWVTLQENNAVAWLDIPTAEVYQIYPLGTKDHSQDWNALDASNRDGVINIQPWPVMGMYMPDAIASYQALGMTWLVTANEGDAREYGYGTAPENCPMSPQHQYEDGTCTYIDEARIKDLMLDPAVFPDAEALQADEAIGRLKVVATEGDQNDDGKYEALYSYGARSISIWDTAGNQVFDSGALMEWATAMYLPENFNSSNDANDSFDDRSDDKGPEPEGVAIGAIGDRRYAFVALERVSGVMVFDVTWPWFTAFEGYFSNRDFSVVDVEAEPAGDLGPEGIVFIHRNHSPNGKHLLVTGNEVSGTTTVYEIVVSRS